MAGRFHDERECWSVAPDIVDSPQRRHNGRAFARPLCVVRAQLGERSRDLREHLQVLVDAGEPGAHRVHGGVGRTDRAPALGDRDEPVQLACPVQPWLQADCGGITPGLGRGLRDNARGRLEFRVRADRAGILVVVGVSAAKTNDSPMVRFG